MCGVGLMEKETKYNKMQQNDNQRDFKMCSVQKGKRGLLYARLYVMLVYRGTFGIILVDLFHHCLKQKQSKT